MNNSLETVNSKSEQAGKESVWLKIDQISEEHKENIKKK